MPTLPTTTITAPSTALQAKRTPVVRKREPCDSAMPSPRSRPVRAGGHRCSKVTAALRSIRPVSHGLGSGRHECRVEDYGPDPRIARARSPGASASRVHDLTPDGWRPVGQRRDPGRPGRLRAGPELRVGRSRRCPRVQRPGLDGKETASAHVGGEGLDTGASRPPRTRARCRPSAHRRRGRHRVRT